MIEELVLPHPDEAEPNRERETFAARTGAGAPTRRNAPATRAIASHHVLNLPKGTPTITIVMFLLNVYPNQEPVPD